MAVLPGRRVPRLLAGQAGETGVPGRAGRPAGGESELSRQVIGSLCSHFQKTQTRAPKCAPPPLPGTQLPGGWSSLAAHGHKDKRLGVGPGNRDTPRVRENHPEPGPLRPALTPPRLVTRTTQLGATGSHRLGCEWQACHARRLGSPGAAQSTSPPRPRPGRLRLPRAPSCLPGAPAKRLHSPTPWPRSRRACWPLSGETFFSVNSWPLEQPSGPCRRQSGELRRGERPPWVGGGRGGRGGGVAGRPPPGRRAERTGHCLGGPCRGLRSQRLRTRQSQHSLLPVNVQMSQSPTEQLPVRKRRILHEKRASTPRRRLRPRGRGARARSTGVFQDAGRRNRPQQHVCVRNRRDLTPFPRQRYRPFRRHFGR